MFLIDRGDKLADNLESAIRSNEKNDTKLAEYEEGVNVDMSHLAAPKKKQKNTSEQEFLRALRAVR